MSSGRGPGLNGMTYAPVNGLDIHYSEQGSGDPLVLLHGGLLTTDLTFGPVQAELAKGRRVIGIELQGHGHTADVDREFTLADLASDVVGVLDHLGIERADVFGFSLGGVVTMELLTGHPQRVRRAVVASAHYREGGYRPEISDPAAELAAAADGRRLRSDGVRARRGVADARPVRGDRAQDPPGAVPAARLERRAAARHHRADARGHRRPRLRAARSTPSTCTS